MASTGYMVTVYGAVNKTSNAIILFGLLLFCLPFGITIWSSHYDMNTFSLVYDYIGERRYLLIGA